MNRSLRRSLLALAALLPSHASPARAAERSEIPIGYTWNLSDLYPSEAAWSAARDDLAGRIPRMGAFQGHLGAAPDSLYAALSALMDLQRDLARLATYASQLSDQDLRDSGHLGMREAAERLGVELSSAASYVRPEILAIGGEKVRAYLGAEPRLKEYRPYLENILRYEKHTLSAQEEKVAAQAGRLENAGNTIRDLFNNAELPWPTVTLTTGEVRLDDAAYTRYRQAVSRADRDTVFRAFWRAHRDFKGTYGAALNAQVQSHIFERDVHKYASCVEGSLFGDNIPPRVYTQLLDDVHANLPTLHRYLRLRQRMMGVKPLRYEDLYAPIVSEVKMSFSPEQAMSTVLEALAPLGKAYVDTLRKGFASRWIDWMPSTGKASGAYSTGAYGVHPYQLQNFTGLYDEVGTLAHESGHSMHTYFADRTQPFVTHDYATFVAEVASTLNENLLFHHMLDRTKDKPTRLYVLGSYLDNLRGTLFRQTLFAEFELRMHEMAEKDETLTGDNLSELYLGLVRKYLGHDQGVCQVDSLYGVEWSYIPHFFYDFYVYQYATSIVASTALANGIREEAALGKSTRRRDAYLDMLRAGSSKYPIDLLKDAGVDMTTPAPFRAAMLEMNAVMDEMDKLLK
ncbi:MAG TPA: oligoendopeptidase F [Candidatus Eisenbacteria bacterium]|jgi:oligoendopeptidase F